ncbi:transcription antitermination factor NusB [Pelagibacteraceae bacterium]|jgi:transcription antitermination protein NusB|nr:transcription antitermination protein NusB [Pelagibacteraceae bacterium]MDC0954253.1 transcription antitermination factor NusB [Pelagibacteraceae bacterium]
MKGSSRLVVIQKIYEKISDSSHDIKFPKSSYIRIIKKVFNGFFEKEANLDHVLSKNLSSKISFKNLDMILKIILKAAIFEIIYMPKIPFKVIVDEYLAVTEMYYDSSQKGLVNAVLDSVFKSEQSQI